MKQRLESVVLGVTLGAVPVIVCFLAGWWGSLPCVPETSVWQWALAGMVCGMLVDMLFLRRWMRQEYAIKTRTWKALYVFYSVGTLGFFMGVPVFNLFLAVPAGAFVGRWLAHTGADRTQMKRTARTTVSFTTCVLTLVCLASASIALASTSTPSDLQGLLRLPFRVERWMVLCIVIAGGTMMLALNSWITNRSVERSYEYFCSLEHSPAVATVKVVS